MVNPSDPRYCNLINPSRILPRNSTRTSHHQILLARPSGELSSFTSPEHQHTLSFNHLAAVYIPHMPSPANDRHTSICLQTLSTFGNKIFSKFTKHSHPPFIMNTLAPPYHPHHRHHTPPPPPTPHHHHHCCTR